MSDETQTLNREAWLTQFVSLAVLPRLKDKTNLTLSEGTLKLSCGFPSRGGTARKKKRIGECFHSAAFGRRTHEIFVHPSLDDTVAVGETVFHEVLHAVLPAGVGHRKPFSQAAKKLGLLPEGAKPTSTRADAELAEYIRRFEAELGPYPHDSLDAGGGPKQSTRLLKVMCKVCGYTIRVTSKWIDEAGCPICPTCLCSMEEAETEDSASIPLVSAEQTVVYKVKKLERKPGERNPWDPRWFIQMHRKDGDASKWLVVDYGPAVEERELVMTREDGSTFRAVEPVARLGVFEPPEGDLSDWTLGEETPVVTYPRHTRAESRDHAIELLEGLRDGTLTYEELGIERDEGADVDDTFFIDEDEDEILDTEDEFTDEELEVYEQEMRDREQGRPKVNSQYGALTNDQLRARIKELESLNRSINRRGRKAVR